MAIITAGSKKTGNTREIFVDNDDYEWLSHFNWQLDKNGCPMARINGDRIYMSRLIMEVKDPLIYVDHINGDTSDNRRRNLRLATNSQNQANRKKLPTNTSGYRGVTWNKQSGKWQAQIKCNGQNYYLGLFQDPEIASLAYKNKAKTLFGEYICLEVNR